MLEPLGVEQKSISTSLGRMVYYTPSQPPWRDTDTPTEQPTIVFFHGFGGGSSAYEWSKVYPAFVEDYRILAPDLMGWGRSQHPERNYQPEDYLQTLQEFIETTTDGPIIAIASSLTAALILRLAVASPHLFQTLILTTPSGLSDFGQDYRQSLIVQIINTPFLDNLLYRGLIATSGGIENFLSTRQFAQPERIYPEIIQAYLQSAQQPNAEYAALSFVRGDLCFDLAKYVPQLTIPTAFLWGQKSQFTSPNLGKRLAQLNPETVKIFCELENVGLTPQLELPALTIGFIRHCLKQLTTHN
ncbi:alpha/beta hydrolase [Spirulina sp. CS-785/01]|uniref:alpha/beta fold hydrolase n=1 Tax=Spirulina sp. CS-785/01 TaxID=3021716 RepID=UPI00232EC3DB|nr:alpha/beta hydrolase [Spirulina sp. CS-785/01]MDB9313998.1 alpha/beta hydrolase [Spirulina sp. CS-785/01]